MRFWFDAYFGALFVISFGGCSLSTPFDSDSLDPSLTAPLGNRPRSTDCQGARFGSEGGLSVAEFRTLLTCLNQNKTLIKTEEWISAIPDSELTLWVSWMNQGLLQKGDRLAQWNLALKTGRTLGFFSDMQAALARTLSDAETMHALFRLLTNLLEPGAAEYSKALAMVGSEIKTESVLQTLRFLRDSPSFQELLISFQNSNASERKRMLELFREHLDTSRGEADFVTKIIGGFSEKNYFDLVDGLSNRHKKNSMDAARRLGRFARLTFHEERAQVVSQLFKKFQSPLPCWNQNATVQDPVSFLSGEVARLRPTEAREYFRREFWLEFRLLDGFCAVDADVFKNFSVIREYWTHPEEFETAVHLVQGFHEIGDIDFFKNYFAQDRFRPLDRMLESWSETRTVENLFLLFTDILPQNRSAVISALQALIAQSPQNKAMIRAILDRWFLSDRGLEILEDLRTLTLKLTEKDVTSLIDGWDSIRKLGLDESFFSLFRDTLKSVSLQSDFAIFWKGRLGEPAFYQASQSEWSRLFQSGEMFDILESMLRMLSHQKSATIQDQPSLAPVGRSHSLSWTGGVGYGPVVSQDACLEKISGPDWVENLEVCFGADYQFGQIFGKLFFSSLPNIVSHVPSGGLGPWFQEALAASTNLDLQKKWGQALQSDALKQDLQKLATVFSKTPKGDQKKIIQALTSVFHSDFSAELFASMAQSLRGPPKPRLAHPVPNLSLDETIAAVQKIEAINDPRHALHRAQQVIVDEVDSLNSYEYLSDGSRRFQWKKEEFERRLENALQKVDATTLQALGELFGRETSLAAWLRDRARDFRLIAFVPKGQKKPIARWINTLEALELVVGSANFKDPLGVQYSTKFTQWIGLSWGDEDPAVWPTEIQALYPDPKKERPPTLAETLHRIQQWLRTAKDFDWALGGDIRGSLLNLDALWPIVLENLPASGHANAGGLRTIRNLFFSLWKATPQKYQDSHSGEKNKLTLVIDMVNLGLLHQIGLSVWDLDIEDSTSKMFFKFLSRDFKKASTRAVLFRMLNGKFIPQFVNQFWDAEELPRFALWGKEALASMAEFDLSDDFFIPLEKASESEWNEAVRGLMRLGDLGSAIEFSLPATARAGFAVWVQQSLSQGVHRIALGLLGRLPKFEYSEPDLGAEAFMLPILDALAKPENQGLRAVLSRFIDADGMESARLIALHGEEFELFCNAFGAALERGELSRFFGVLSRAFPR